jgi:hypothetical protein
VPSSNYIPQVVYDIYDAFLGAVDPLFGMAETIVGTYETIRDIVNIATHSSYTTTDIGQGLVWIRRFGASEFGATINKAGPGGRVLEVLQTNGTTMEVPGNVYSLIGQNQALDEQRWDLAVVPGLLGWAIYEDTTNENDLNMVALFLTVVPANLRRTKRGQAIIAKLQHIQALKAAVKQEADALITLLG